ncbi:type I-F CRISPR-associated protein Csy2 [Nevskia sp.]|uniref:type I-F CRISPR-associated protein Csy2 n=1 Tax=Nevskia sp. TaxID=1929292 RepID=UPI003F6E4B96
MSRLPDSSGLLILPRLRIQNANAISSPLTHGFPAMSAFVGLMWALQRKLTPVLGPRLRLSSVGVICHDHDEQVTEDGYTRAFRLTRNPVDKDGSTAAIVEEGRIHLDITLVFGVDGGLVDEGDAERAAVARQIADILSQMRVAGGTVLPAARTWRWSQPQLLPIPEDPSDRGPWFRSLRRRWLPGFALVSRDDLLAEAVAGSTLPGSAIEAWLKLSRLNWSPPAEADPQSGRHEWQHDRTRGWIVPIPVGYGVLVEHPADAVANARDPTVPFRFVESLYSIGQWIGPHRLQSWHELLWYPEHDPASGLYRVRNGYAVATSFN